MLQAIRDKTSGWFATIVLGLIIVTMMFFGIEGYMRPQPRLKSVSPQNR